MTVDSHNLLGHSHPWWGGQGATPCTLSQHPLSLEPCRDGLISSHTHMQVLDTGSCKDTHAHTYTRAHMHPCSLFGLWEGRIPAAPAWKGSGQSAPQMRWEGQTWHAGLWQCGPEWVRLEGALLQGPGHPHASHEAVQARLPFIRQDTPDAGREEPDEARSGGQGPARTPRPPGQCISGLLACLPGILLAASFCPLHPSSCVPPWRGLRVHSHFLLPTPPAWATRGRLAARDGPGRACWSQG